MIPGEILERAYRAFAACQPNPGVPGCPHCVEPEEGMALTLVPLRELGCEQLGRYTFKALTTWGDERDYRHFLPRLLELAVTEEGLGQPGLEPGTIAGKLELAGWPGWTAEERGAVLAWFEALRALMAPLEPEARAWSLEELDAALARLGRPA